MNKIISNSNPFAGVIYALAATLLWSGNFVVARGLSDSVPPISLAFYRWLVATLVFTPFAIKSLIRDWQKIKANLAYIVVCSILGVSIFNTLIYVAGQTTTAINLSLISISFPVFIVIISRIIFKERISFFRVLGIIIVAAGVILIISKGDLSRIKDLSFSRGDFWMLLAAIIFAGYSILVKRKPGELGLISFQYSTFLIGLLIILPFFLLECSYSQDIEFSSSIVGSILYIGICSSIISFVMWNKAIDTIGPTKAGMIYYLMPLFSGIVAWVIIDEDLGLIHLLSGLLIVSGIILSNRKRKSPK